MPNVLNHLCRSRSCWVVCANWASLNVREDAKPSCVEFGQIGRDVHSCGLLRRMLHYMSFQIDHGPNNRTSECVVLKQQILWALGMDIWTDPVNRHTQCNELNKNRIWCIWEDPNS
jgi:hypothetical protein